MNRLFRAANARRLSQMGRIYIPKEVMEKPSSRVE